MTKEEILSSLNSVDYMEWEVVDSIYLNNLDTTAHNYSHVDGYFYSDSFNKFWVLDPHDFDSNGDLINPVWLKSL